MKGPAADPWAEALLAQSWTAPPPLLNLTLPFACRQMPYGTAAGALATLLGAVHSAEPVAGSSCRLPGGLAAVSAREQSVGYTTTCWLTMQLRALTAWLLSCRRAPLQARCCPLFQSGSLLLTCCSTSSPESSTQKPWPPARVPLLLGPLMHAVWLLQWVVLVASMTTRLPLGSATSLGAAAKEAMCVKEWKTRC